jgi:hypothetical protein
MSVGYDLDQVKGAVAVHRMAGAADLVSGSRAAWPLWIVNVSRIPREPDQVSRKHAAKTEAQPFLE